MKTLQIVSKHGIYDFKLDDADYERISAHKWSVHKGNSRIYARRDVWLGSRETRKGAMLHRQVWGEVPKGMFIDHINGDTLDNRRCNLRLATQAQNSINAGLRKTNTSGFKGVYFNKSERFWMAALNTDGKRIHLGCFATPQEAAAAYDKAVIEHFGEFARTNAMLREEASNG